MPQAKPYPLVHYHGRNYTDSTVTLSVRGQRYEYFLTPPQCDTVEFLCQRVSARKALNFAKSRASRVLKIRATSTSSTTGSTAQPET